jgi:cation transporter-like permease
VLQLIVRHRATITFLLALISMFAGVLLQEHAKVFDQAIRICLSCIGIG